MAGIIGGDKPVQAPVDEDDHTTPWTLDQVKKYNGKGPDGKIYISCNGKVFDVTSSPNYQPGGSYENFGGHDVSIACAHFDTDSKWLDIPYDPENNNLTFSQSQSLNDYYIGFCQKYRVMGKMIEWTKDAETKKTE